MTVICMLSTLVIPDRVALLADDRSRMHCGFQGAN